MAIKIEDFLIKAVHTFQIRSLQSLNFLTRVSLINKSDEAGYATNYRVDLTVYGPDRQIEKTVEGIGTIRAGERLSLDCQQWDEKDGKDRIMIFHLIPEKMIAELATSKTTTVDKDEQRALMVAQDHHVEYYREDGYSSGVLYTSGSFNYDKFSKESSAIVQAPKIYISNSITTYFSLMHTAMTSDYNVTASIKCALVGSSGRCVAKWVTKLKPFETVLLDLKEIVKALDPECNTTLGPDLRFYTLYAVCNNATLLPLIINYNELKHTLAVEHSLPPIYYGAKMFGPSRSDTLKELANIPMFSEN